MRRLFSSVRPCVVPPPIYDVGVEVSREKVSFPIYDENGKKVCDQVKDVVVKKPHDVSNNPNAGLLYTDFDVEALERVGVVLSPVNPVFVGQELCETDSQLNSVAQMEQEFFEQSEKSKTE